MNKTSVAELSRSRVMGESRLRAASAGSGPLSPA
jgi:hypothetical protein